VNERDEKRSRVMIQVMIDPCREWFLRAVEEEAPEDAGLTSLGSEVHERLLYILNAYPLKR